MEIGFCDKKGNSLWSHAMKTPPRVGDEVEFSLEFSYQVHEINEAELTEEAKRTFRSYDGLWSVKKVSFKFNKYAWNKQPVYIWVTVEKKKEP